MSLFEKLNEQYRRFPSDHKCSGYKNHLLDCISDSKNYTGLALCPSLPVMIDYDLSEDGPRAKCPLLINCLPDIERVPRFQGK